VFDALTGVPNTLQKITKKNSRLPNGGLQLRNCEQRRLWLGRPGAQGDFSMSSAVVQFNIIPVRMMKATEAARHCGRSLTRFKIECPVTPVKFSNGELRYDVQDLDVWLNSLKAGAGDHEADAIIARLVK